MDCYLDIKMLPDSEFSENILMNALFAKLHRILILTQGEVGISFPNFNKTLGNQLRLHGSEVHLKKLINESWLKGLQDYTFTSSIQKTPDMVRYRVVRRVQSKSNPERLFRRSVKKGWLSEQEALARVSLGKTKQLKHPFLEMKSQSTGQRFRLFIAHGPLIDHPVSGIFSSYGLSDKATIPWF